MRTCWTVTAKDKRVPQRSCVACRQVREKKQLIRLVMADSGIVEVDAFGKKPGRGAYVCLDKTCWEAALKKNRLDYALRTRLCDDNRQALRSYFCHLEGS